MPYCYVLLLPSHYTNDGTRRIASKHCREWTGGRMDGGERRGTGGVQTTVTFVEQTQFNTESRELHSSTICVVVVVVGGHDEVANR